MALRQSKTGTWFDDEAQDPYSIYDPQTGLSSTVDTDQVNINRGLADGDDSGVGSPMGSMWARFFNVLKGRGVSLGGTKRTTSSSIATNPNSSFNNNYFFNSLRTGLRNAGK